MEFRFKGKRRQVYRPFILPNRGNVPIQPKPTTVPSKPVANIVKSEEKTPKTGNDKKVDYNTTFENKKEPTKEEQNAKTLNNDILKKNNDTEIKSEPEKTQMIKDKVIITNENNKSKQENTQKEIPIQKPVPDAKVDTTTTVTKPPEKSVPVKSVPPTVKSTPTINPPACVNKSAADPEILKKLSVLDKEKIKRILQQNESKKQQFKKDDLENKVIGLVKNFMSNYEDNINSILSKNFQTNNSISSTITNTLCEAIDQIQETIPKPPKK